jgi:ribonuclease HII
MIDGFSCGVDEAGRGPIIGPMVMACVLVDDNGLKKLKELEVKDSKKLSPKNRERLEPLIKEVATQWVALPIQAQEIDLLRKTQSLNQVEAHATAHMIISLKEHPSRIVIDAADAIEANYARRILSEIESIQPGYKVPELICEHRADANHLEVSAASIIAKVERDRAIEALKEDLGDFGSGYTSDERTRDFIKKALKSGELPSCIRRSWVTLDKCRQTSIGEY